ncbi:NADH-quinone oxidoreductase subunit L [Acidiphilium iwatense]|uniref:NADH-quinone oxidoreductase subunit L n=1 Tax=Acidiphilium iwatense TaxID=768198 RepID=A0ABS9DYA7_9PROT|nr:NADH-quinone oxidoreductase subunit L [Acidiphilium iwatense]MCF3947150.1 NADH-quinone oxidoreductase subunit L [Acidiphilium iwatense]
MIHDLWLVPAFPLLGAAILMISAGRLPSRAVALVGVVPVAVSAIVSAIIGIGFMAAPPSGHAFTEILWRWIAIGGFRPAVGLYLDPLSLVMMLVVTIVGFLILLYSTEFMAGDEGYSRFFAYMNLFVSAMLVLLLASNLLFLYVGWEGVGLCSYLLIGFWYQDAANGLAARKAFIVTRIGDTGLMIGLFVLFTHLGTLDIQPLLHRAASVWPHGSAIASLATALLLIGALGKSAQIPLQTWLPDAMAGPTPVSALIHAATMVTAGVYLIARMHGLYMLAPAIQMTVAAIGAATLFVAAFAALNQHDIKRILAYSTVSQIGYMFLALGVGAWTAAIFHFMAHAFFKALLFLAAGAITMRLEHHEHDIFRMGGLAKKLPVAFWSFLIGSASLAALPLVTAGFYSKEMILSETWAHGGAVPILWAAGLVTAFVTALYIFRAVFIVFFGEAKTPIVGRYGIRIVLPLAVLSVLAVIGGFVETPNGLGGVTIFSRFMGSVFGPAPLAAGATETALLVFASLVSLSGVGLAWLLYMRPAPRFAAWTQTPSVVAWRAFFLSGWGFDVVYDRLVVRPFLYVVRINRHDAIDDVYTGIAEASRGLHRLLKLTQTGRIRWYAGWLAAGSILTIAVAVIR